LPTSSKDKYAMLQVGLQSFYFTPARETNTGGTFYFSFIRKAFESRSLIVLLITCLLR